MGTTVELFQRSSYAIARGLYDSSMGFLTLANLDKKIQERELQTPVRRQTNKKDAKPAERPKVLERTLQCCLLNGGVFLASILVFDYILLPSMKRVLFLLGTDQYMWSWTKSLLSWTFGAVWVLPIFLLSKMINALWFQDIADSAYRYSRGRPVMMASISKTIADFLFSLLVQSLFLLQAMLVSTLPLYPMGEILSMVHMSLLYSLYAFEYKWFNMGWELHKRLTFIETQWPYFLGFGLPLTIVTSISASYIINGCLFSILFPWFIVSANEAQVVSNSCEYPLQLFMPVIAVSNVVFNKTIGTGVNASAGNLAVPRKQKTQG
ncbi:etoposide-induced protein 2.4 homolog [Neocloeon triangulifer]|uniref:etoposide-induced protein 2.4 homolog n=1 Tax=Neocloeon triangulifer TaxID=2078957 RepID=UPI00286F904C|nr:etoposide-induced protein 2.4 homolog [Neocloeon triangulifer]